RATSSRPIASSKREPGTGFPRAAARSPCAISMPSPIRSPAPRGPAAPPAPETGDRPPVLPRGTGGLSPVLFRAPGARVDGKPVREVREEVFEVVQLLGSGGEWRGAHALEALADLRLQRHGIARANVGPAHRLPDRRRERHVRVALARTLQVA